MSNRFALGGSLTLSCPDGFHLMDGKEKQGLQFLVGGEGECLSDPERHILISVGWKSVGALAAFLVSAKDAAGKAEAAVRGPMQDFGYELIRTAPKSVGSETAEGFCYAYEAQGVAMYGETCVVKRGRTLYYLNLYARRELLDESLDVWNGILSSAEWS